MRSLHVPGVGAEERERPPRVLLGDVRALGDRNLDVLAVGGRARVAHAERGGRGLFGGFAGAHGSEEDEGDHVVHFLSLALACSLEGVGWREGYE